MHFNTVFMPAGLTSMNKRWSWFSFLLFPTVLPGYGSLVLLIMLLCLWIKACCVYWFHKWMYKY